MNECDKTILVRTLQFLLLHVHRFNMIASAFLTGLFSLIFAKIFKLTTTTYKCHTQQNARTISMCITAVVLQFTI